MAEQLKSIKSLVQAAALVFFVLQMVFAVQKYLDKPTMRSPATKPFVTYEKLMLISVCKASQFNYNNDIGYNRMGDYVKGTPNDTTMLSWTGLQGNLTPNETLNFLFNSDKDNFTSLNGDINGNIKEIEGNITTRFLLPLGLCKIFTGKFKSHLDISFKDDKNMSEYFIFVSDPAAAPLFHLPYSLMTGDSMELETRKGVHVNFNVQLKETSTETGDNTCVDYPSTKHTSYTHCVEEEMRENLFPTLGCMVPWISAKDQCNNPIKRLPAHENIVHWIQGILYGSFGGVPYTSVSCPVPCTLLSAHSKYQISSIENYGRAVYLYFKDTVEVERIVLAYDETSLLVEIGSCLGLWLGLSVVGIYDILVLLVIQTKELFIKLY